MTEIDTAFDCRSDTPRDRNGRPKDPDTHSPTLCAYHQRLWSKPLPTGQVFELEFGKPPFRLCHDSDLGKFTLKSDAVIPTFSRAREFVDIIQSIPPEETEAFNRLAYTIGGMMVFPGTQVGRRMTINQARGCNGRVRDRFDLTVECIRRHYLGEASPLSRTLDLYPEFFRLFGDFAGYVNFFLLQDLVQDTGAVTFFAPFDGFDVSPLPRPRSVYLEYRRLAMEFLEARNNRIAISMNG